MPVVGLAEVLLQPVFTGSQRAIEREIGPAAQRAGRTAGRGMGQGMADGLRTETAALEVEVNRLGKAVSSAQDRVTAAKERTQKAAAAESSALGALRVAELKLNETREAGNAKASVLAAAEERVTAARARAATATTAHQRSQQALNRTTEHLNTVQGESTTATENLNTAMRQNATDTDRATQSGNRFGAMIRRAFPNRPLAGLVRGMNVDVRQVNSAMDGMITNVQAQGTRGGRAFTRAFVGVTAGLTAVIPAAGAAGSSLIAAAGAVTTLASSLTQLGGIAALAPAGLIAIGAGAGVLKAAFSGMGEALKTATDATDKIASAAANPRLLAMAVEDANQAIIIAEESAAQAAEDASRRVADAKRSLQDTYEATAEARKNAARAVEMAERREAEAVRDVVKAQRELQEAREAAQKRVNEVGRQVFDADRKAVDTAVAYRKAIDKYNEGVKAGLQGDDLATLDNAVAKAYAADVDAKQAVKDLGAEHKKAKKEAKTASEEVLAAEQRLKDAQQAQADAVQARKDAQEDAAKTALDGQRAIADAQQAVTDSTKAAERAQVDSARAVEAAHRNLERVQLQQADQASKAGEESELAMSKLTPAAQVAAAALLDVYDRLKGIRNIAQESFFTGFSGPLLALADTIMPQLETGVGKIATAFGLMAQTALTSLSGALDNGVLESLLTSVSNIITNLTPAIDPLIQAFTTLGLVGMPYLEDMATAISDAAIQFNNFIQGAAADGSLNTWIENGIQGFQDLFRIIGNVSGIVGALAEAARAGGIDVTLGSLADALGRVRTAMEGPVFQDTAGTVFAGAKAGMEGLSVAFEKLGAAFVVGKDNFAEFLRLGGEISGLALGGLFTALSDPTFGAGLTTFLEGVKGGVETLAPMLPGLTAAVGSVLDALAPIVENLGPTLVQVFTDFATAIGKVIEFLSPMLEYVAGSPALLGFLIAAFTATAAAAAGLTLAANGVRIALALYRGAMFAVRAATVIATGVQWLFNAALTANPIGLVIAAVALLVAGLVWFFTQTEVGQKIVRVAWAWIKSAVKSVVDWFTNTAKPALGAFATAVGKFFSDLWHGKIKPITTWIKDKWKDTITFFTRDVPNAFKTFVTKVAEEWDKLKEKAKVPIRFVVNKVINEGLIDTFNKIPGVNIKPIRLPKGFRKGGYTGDIPEDQAAGIVHGREFVFDAAATAAAGPKRLAAMAAALRSGKSHPEQCAHSAAANGPARPTNSGFFMGNVGAIKPDGAYYMDVASGLGPWNFGGAAKLWDGAAGLRVRTGRGRHQGYITERERGGGILGYTTGTNIDMSPSWKGILGPKQRLTVAAHEVGHAIGLPHDVGGASIMNPNLAGMAPTPTKRDIGNLQYLYPGGSGKAGQAEAENPFGVKVVNSLMGLIKKQFPDAGMFVDVAGGVLKHGITKITRFIDDIKSGISKIAGNVVNSIKGFFGKGGAQAPEDYLLRDTGGVLPPGFSKVLNATGQNEYVVNNRQMRSIGELAEYKAQPGGDVWNVELPPRSSVDDLMNAVSFQQRRNRRGGRVG